MNCVILQPSYIPWRGFFHQIQKADLFIFYDDVQFDKRSWRNRNRIKTAQGADWLTIPVYSKGHQLQHTPVNEIRICWDTAWNRKHWRSIEQHYGRAPFFERYQPLIEPYFCRQDKFLGDFVIDFTMTLARELGLNATRFLRSSTLSLTGSRTERLLNALRQVGATHYITGPSARSYLEQDRFLAEGISVEFMDYSYPEYPQRFPPFDPQVSILDLLFMTGPEAPRYIWETPVRNPITATAPQSSGNLYA